MANRDRQRERGERQTKGVDRIIGDGAGDFLNLTALVLKTVVVTKRRKRRPDM